MKLKYGSQSISTIILLIIFFISRPGLAQEQLSLEEVNGWFETLSNWGRWGGDDQLGTVNLITQETRVAAAGLVQSGISVSMAHEILTEEAADNGNPYDHRMTAVGSSPGPWSGDFIGVSYHGYAHSHLDALCHRFSLVPCITATLRMKLRKRVVQSWRLRLFQMESLGAALLWTSQGFVGQIG
jgi:hypothetical protein